MINHKNIYLICIVLLMITIAFDFVVGIPLFWYFLPLIFLFLAIVIGSFKIGYNFFLNSFCKKEVLEKKIAITFDDGPDQIYTPKVLSLLRQYEAKATFFCIGKNISSFPEILQEISDEGHSIGNHSYSHKYSIGFSSIHQWSQEIEKTDLIIQKTVGLNCNLFRPPFGVTTPNLAKAIRKSGHKVVGWNIRTCDTLITNPKFILNNIKRKLKPGSIILLHDTHERIPVVLEQLLKILVQHNYKMVTIEDLMNEK